MSEPIDQLRAVAAAIPPAPATMAQYLTKVRERAFTVTDSDVEALRTAGLSEDEIFEQTIGAAIAQGLHRLDTAVEAIG